MNDWVILVDEKDNELGLMEKLEAHRKGLLHRAFSVVLFNKKGQILLQRRSAQKYHGAGLWSNTCCSHPRQHEKIHEAANRRLREEMGIDCTLTVKFNFIYQASMENGLVEHEFDHVVFGEYCDAPQINNDEVSDWKYVDLEWLKQDLQDNPQLYTPWFPYIIKQL